MICMPTLEEASLDSGAAEAYENLASSTFPSSNPFQVMDLDLDWLLGADKLT